MERIIEEDRDELRDIDEFFSWEEHDEAFAKEDHSDKLTDYASDIRNNLRQILSGMQTRESRYKITRM